MVKVVLFIDGCVVIIIKLFVCMFEVLLLSLRKFVVKFVMLFFICDNLFSLLKILVIIVLMVLGFWVLVLLLCCFVKEKILVLVKFKILLMLWFLVL